MSLNLRRSHQFFTGRYAAATTISTATSEQTPTMA